MASVQEAEVQFAQRLASNEKPIRTKAMKKLRKYINVRSQKTTGGFTSEELLKLWKGLFYCLWMQDKPLLQEELSKQISNLIHSFHEVNGQFLYLESFLQTFKREWMGIDRLRMDKFFQLIRFMFRQTFEILKRRSWESSMVSSFLELLTVQLLQSNSGAPSGLQFHILDLYMTELAAVGSAELTADQNLIFIEPFCKTAAKTKDRTLLGAICRSIFSTIIDQAPFAIEDLMKEIKAAGASDSDSGQASEGDDEGEQQGESTKGKPPAGKQINGNKANGKEDEDDDDELLHLENSDTEAPCDEDVGPVLQFDYGALANKLFELSSRSSTPSQNRQRLYKIIKVLRDLSTGIFPQDEYPEEVSTDEDDEMFGSRKRMKQGGHHMEEGAPASKKRKVKKKKASAGNQQSKELAIDGNEPAEPTASNDDKKKKRKKRKKKKKAAEGKNAEKSEHVEAEQEVQVPVSQSGLHSELKEPPSVPITEVCNPNTPCMANREEHSKNKQEQLQPAGQQMTQTDASSNSNMTISGKKKKKMKLEADESEPLIQINNEENAEQILTTETKTTTPTKKKKNLEVELKVNGVSTDESRMKLVDSTSAKKKSKKKKAGEVGQDEITSVGQEPAPDTTPIIMKKKGKQEETPPESSPSVDESATTPLKRKKTKNNQVDSTVKLACAEELITEMVPAQKRKKNKRLSAVPDETVVNSEEVEHPVDDAEVQSVKKRKIPVVFEFEAEELEASVSGVAEQETGAKKAKLLNDVEKPSTPRSTKKAQKKTKTSLGSESDFIAFQSKATVPSPLFCKSKGSPRMLMSSKKKIQTPKSESKKVTFGLKNNKTAEFRKTDRSLLLSPDGSSRVPFDPEQKPKFGVLKSPATPILRAKKTPIRKIKTDCNTQECTPKRRALAADFF